MSVREPVSKVHVEPPAPCEPTSGKTVFRALTNTAIGATAFLLTCIGLRAILPFPEIDGGVSQKFRFFAAHKDEFDTLFIGSSRVYFQISPAIFDRVTRESGLPTHSFNFGIGGMYLPESAYLLEQILNLKPRNLRWVFIEYDEVQTKWSPENQTSRRALYWADWKRVSLLLRKPMPVLIRFGCRVRQNFATLFCVKKTRKIRIVCSHFMRGSLKKTIPTSQEQLMFQTISCVATQRNVAQATWAQPAMAT